MKRYLFKPVVIPRFSNEQRNLVSNNKYTWKIVKKYGR